VRPLDKLNKYTQLMPDYDKNMALRYVMPRTVTRTSSDVIINVVNINGIAGDVIR